MIILIRHCTPKIDYSACSYPEAKKRINEYNTTKNIALAEINFFKDDVSKILTQQKPTIIYASSLPRALLTAKAMFDEQNIIINDNFVEFALDIVPIPLMKFKFRTWLFISRILWFLGILKTEKNFADERSRAIKCAELLAKQAEKATVILVAHGLLNIFIERQLKKMQYNRISKIKNNCFQVTKLEKCSFKS